MVSIRINAEDTPLLNYRYRGASSRCPLSLDLKWVPCGRGMPEGCEVAVLHGNPKTGPSEVVVRMPQSYRFPAHWHTANERITVVKRNPSFTVKGGEAITTRPSTYLFLPGKTAHAGQCGDTEACVLSIALDKPLDLHAAGAKR